MYYDCDMHTTHEVCYASTLTDLPTKAYVYAQVLTYLTFTQQAYAQVLTADGSGYAGHCYGRSNYANTRVYQTNVRSGYKVECVGRYRKGQ